MVPTPLLVTKLHIPPHSVKLVPRPRLIARLNEGLQFGHKLTLTSAPAGFGKTMLLSEWAASPELEGRVAWLALDKEDNVPSRFWAYVNGALQKILPKADYTASASFQALETPSIEAVLIPLVNQIAANKEKIILVLDDYHLVTKEEIQQGMTIALPA